MRTSILTLVLILSAFSSQAQYIPISETAEVSILTIGPGDALYDKFGHSAFRIKDEIHQYDIVYNYGVYDFSTPNFYTKFARGKLLYLLATESYEPFLTRYKRQDRWVKEQILNLNETEKEAVFRFLQDNAKPENRAYKYDFFYDNCATKIRDVLQEVLGDRLTYSETISEEPYTFRDLIQHNLAWNSWGSLGIDIALGAVIDKEATPIEYQFLPDYVFKASENAKLQRGHTSKPLVKNTATLYESTRTKVSSNFIMSPLFIFGIIALVIIYLTVRDFRNNKRSRFLDALIFFVTGLAGALLLFLWFGTDHTATYTNYNLLWAFPLSLLFCVLIGKAKPKSWLQRYVFFLILLLALMFFHWFTGVQVFAKALIPFLIALVVRYIYLVGYLKRENKEAVNNG
ncbi:hypothetical protein ULVI_14720 [Cochleicola gelatinilyticus]|uniref:Uncharacterized protein n=1 Tax=Cochleicola gelatinilyticus TaxID=1763537 RepID=A0A167ES62_9FLAO|nr:hypothetical protein ULVI_14720 [Cochleicola gelatinilyticus]